MSFEQRVFLCNSSTTSRQHSSEPKYESSLLHHGISNLECYDNKCVIRMPETFTKYLYSNKLHWFWTVKYVICMCNTIAVDMYVSTCVYVCHTIYQQIRCIIRYVSINIFWDINYIHHAYITFTFTFILCHWSWWRK